MKKTKTGEDIGEAEYEGSIAKEDVMGAFIFHW